MGEREVRGCEVGMTGKRSDLERIRGQLRKMAFGKVNDCVKLALSEYEDIAKLDLSMLTEIKRSDKGGVELKLLDRTKILAQLAQLCDDEERSQTARQLLKALGQSEVKDDGT